MSQRRPYVAGLDWDERNQTHVEEHIDADLIEELFEGGDWFAFSNYGGHPPEHRLFIGQTPAGLFVTVVLRDLSHERRGLWRPITGWRSTKAERERFRQERDRTRKRYG
jgi:hypothetical protein